MVSESGFRPPSVCVCVFQDECMLEAALQERAQILFQVLLQYITGLMMWEEGDELPGEIEPRLAKLLLLFLRYRYRSVFFFSTHQVSEQIFCLFTDVTEMLYLSGK